MNHINCTCGKHLTHNKKRVILKHSVSRGRITRLDPSRTITLRRQFQTDLAKRFNKIRAELIKLILEEDALGLKQQSVFNAKDEPGQWITVKGSHIFIPEGEGISSAIKKHFEEKKSTGKIKMLGIEHNPKYKEPFAKELDEYAKKHLTFKGAFVSTPRKVTSLDDKTKTLEVATVGWDENDRVIAFVDRKNRIYLPKDNNKEATKEEVETLLQEIKEQRKKDLVQIHKNTYLFDQPAEKLASKIASETGLEVSIHHPHDSSSRYIYVELPKGGQYKIRFATHEQPTDDGVNPVGGYDKDTGKRHSAADISIDPTTTDTLEKALEQLKKLIKSGKTRKVHNRYTANAGRWQFHSTEQKLAAFREWIKKQVAYFLLSEYADENAWWNKYILEGFKKGANRAFDDTRPQVKAWMDSPEAKQQLSFYNGTREEFLRSAFNHPVSKEKVKILAARTLTDLKGVTDSMAAKLSHGLVDGLTRGDNPIVIAKELAKTVNISKARAATIARTEIIRTHAEGQLTSFEQMGISHVGVMAEWLTAEDEKVCPLCSPLNGVVLKISEARGLLPRHPNCFINHRINIYTADGWKYISKVKVGDLVLTHLGRFREVIQTHRNQGNEELVVEFKIGWGSTGHRIAVTGDHPILVNNKWTAAKDIKSGDKVSWMSSKCAGCGNPIPYGMKYCSIKCQWLNKEHRDNVGKKNSQSLLRQYISGERDGSEITKAAHSKVRDMLAEGTFPMPRLSGGANPAKRPEVRKKIRESKLGDKNPMRVHAEIGKANGKALAKYIKEHPEKHANFICAKKGHKTNIERIMEGCLEKLSLHPKFQHYADGLWIDFAFPEYMVAIECDGNYWHQNKDKDRARDKRLKKMGWTVLHFTEDQIKDTPMSCAGKVRRVLNNHEGNYEFAEFEVVEVTQRKSGKVTLYNLSVAEDESYIAKGCVVHNCRCCWSPANVGEDEEDLARQKRTKGSILGAFTKSYKAELPSRGERTLEEQQERSSWGAIDKVISKLRPKSVLNSEVKS